jgi:hypothetical protein
LGATPERALADNGARILYDKLKVSEREKAELSTAHDITQHQLRRLTVALQTTCKRQQEQQEQQEQQRQEAHRQEGVQVAQLQAQVEELEATNAWMLQEREERQAQQLEEGQRLHNALDQATAAKELLVGELQKIAQGGSGDGGGSSSGSGSGSGGAGGGHSGGNGGLGVSPLSSDNSASGMALHQQMCAAVAELRQRQQRQMAEATALVTAIEMRYVQGYDVHDPSEQECAADFATLQRLVTHESATRPDPREQEWRARLAEQEAKLGEQHHVNADLTQSLEDLRSQINHARMNQLL